MDSSIDTPHRLGTPEAPTGRRGTLLACSGAHVLHDGLTNVLYILLPIWQGELGLSLTEIGLLKTVYSGALAGLQVPSGYAAERFGENRVLVIGTALAGVGYLLAGWTGAFVALAACLALGGAGSSVQHPVSSSLIARQFEGPRLRAALSAYNFAGDVGKALLPALAAWAISVSDWRFTVKVLGAATIAVAFAMVWLLARLGERRHPAAARSPDASTSKGGDWTAGARRGFRALCAIGVVDSGTRGGFLVFLPFLLSEKGASLPTVGLAMTLVFIGGATGKFVCGAIAGRVGVLRTVIITECATAAAILVLLPLPVTASLIFLPIAGIALNGTSSVLYGTVAELLPAGKRARGFGVFYTVGIGASAVAPTVYGAFSDAIGMMATLIVIAVTVLLVVPLTLPLRAPLRSLGAA
jgi:MFS family permease